MDIDSDEGVRLKGYNNTNSGMVLEHLLYLKLLVHIVGILLL